MYKVTKEYWLRKFEKMMEWRANTAKSDSDKNLGPIIYKKVLDSLNIPDGTTLLDVGCGNCRTKSLLSSGITYFGIDPFPIIPESEWGSLGFRLGEAENIPFDESTFDVLICFASIFHFRELDQTFREIYRVLKVGGKFYLMTVMNPELSEAHTFLINHELLNGLGELVNFKFIRKFEVLEIKSWVYEWEK